MEWSVRRLDPLPHQVAPRPEAVDAVQAQLLPVLPRQTLLLRPARRHVRRKMFLFVRPT